MPRGTTGAFARELDVRHYEALVRQGDREIVRRKKPITFAYFASCVLTIIASSYAYTRDHPTVAYSFASLSFAFGAARLYLGLRFDPLYPRGPAAFNRLFRLLTLGQSIAWGAFCGLTIAFYEVTAASMLALACTAGLTAGSIERPGRHPCRGDIGRSPTANRPPVCTSAQPSVSLLWPPEHAMKPIEIQGVSDPDGDPVSVVVSGITQDEPVTGSGSGGDDPAPDGDGLGTSVARVRVERSGKGNGRVYAISFVAKDDKGGQCTGSVRVCVPHDQRPGASCIDDGQRFDSTGH